MQNRVETWLYLPVIRLLGLLNQPRGQTLAEYAMLIALIAVAIVVAGMMVFRNALTDAFVVASGCLDGGCG